MLTVLLVNNALSAQTRLTSLIRRFGGQIMGQVSTLTAMFPLLKQQPISLVLIDLPTQEAASLSRLFLFWIAAGMQPVSPIDNVLFCQRPVRLDPVLNQIVSEAPGLLQRSSALKALAAQSGQIRRAKQVLMETGMNEDEAHHALEKMAMNLRISRGEAARQILTENEQK